MGLVGTNSQGIATSVLAEWVKKVSDLPMPEADKQKLDEYIDDLYNKVGECKRTYILNTQKKFRSVIKTFVSL